MTPKLGTVKDKKRKITFTKCQECRKRVQCSAYEKRLGIKCYEHTGGKL